MNDNEIPDNIREILRDSESEGELSDDLINKVSNQFSDVTEAIRILALLCRENRQEFDKIMINKGILTRTANKKERNSSRLYNKIDSLMSSSGLDSLNIGIYTINRRPQPFKIVLDPEVCNVDNIGEHFVIVTKEIDIHSLERWFASGKELPAGVSAVRFTRIQLVPNTDPSTLSPIAPQPF